MSQLDLERGKPKEMKESKPFKRFSPLLTAAMAVGVAALPVLVEAQPRGRPRADQCSASVQSGTIPSFLTNGNRVTLLSTPLMRPNAYLSVTMPETYMARLRTAASARPEAERQGMIADIFQNNIQAAYSRLGSGSSVTFDCAPLDGSLPAASARPQASAVPSARPQPSASARPAQSADPLSDVRPSVTAVPQPSAAPDAGVPQQRRRSIQP